MSVTVPSPVQEELEQRVRLRTGRRIRNLAVEFDLDRVILKGETSSFYVKQLAQHGVSEFLPHVRLENIIMVDHSLDQHASETRATE